MPSSRSFHLGGNKTIGLIGSICLLANNITGPALVSMGTSYAQSGWLPTTALLTVCGVLSLVSSFFLCESIHGMSGFNRRIEMTDAMKEAGVPRPLLLLSFWSLIGIFMSQNIASICEVGSLRTFVEEEG